MKNLVRTITDENAFIDPITALVDREGCFHIRQGDDHIAFNRRAAKKLRDALGELIELTMDKFRFSRSARATALVAFLGLISFWYNDPDTLTHYKILKLKHVKQVSNTEVSSYSKPLNSKRPLSTT